MKKQAIMYGIAGFIVGGALIGFAATLVAANSKTDSHQDHTMSMEQMVKAVQGKTGDAFDETFISQMIEHHQGAIDMANLARDNAKHQEIKDMANDIISAQAKEISTMQAWQVNWGYKSAQQNHMGN
ncbi:MAG TPA: DUF305 domain-containing protein [Candidatus Saccharimonadales bacterium]|nr:DUF305 domain-containing protein [Candidatus Saccharimonadales bacterium]